MWTTREVRKNRYHNRCSACRLEQLVYNQLNMDMLASCDDPQQHVRELRAIDIDDCHAFIRQLIKRRSVPDIDKLAIST